MELFKLFNGKHVHRSWCHTSILLTNLELSSNSHQPKQVEREEITHSRRTANIFNFRDTGRKDMKKNLQCLNSTYLKFPIQTPRNTLSRSSFLSFIPHTQFNSVKSTSTSFWVSLSPFTSTDNSFVYTLTIVSLNGLLCFWSFHF